jgi:nitrate/nitrite transporter NarK
MLLLGLDFGGETFPWNSPKVICLLVFGTIAIFFFVISEKKFARYPLMPLELFRHRSNLATLVVTACHGVVFIGGEYYMPLYLQSTHSLSPTKSGLFILPYVMMEALMGIFCGVITHRYSAYRELIWVGTVMMTVGTGLYIILDENSSTAMIIGFELFAGAGTGLLFQPVMIAIQAFVEQEQVATASSTLGFIRNMAVRSTLHDFPSPSNFLQTSLGVVIGGIVFQNSMAERTSQLEASGLTSDIVNEFSGSDAAANVGIIGAISDPETRLIIKQAFAWSTRNMWIFYTCVGAVSVVAAAFIKKSTLSEEHVETKTGLLKNEKEGEGVELQTV